MRLYIALALNPSQVSARYTKGSALYRLGRFSQALFCHEKALEIDPYNALVWYGKGAALEALKEHERAKKYFSTAKELRENNLISVENA
ncbi:MAG: tetratricopeptide repeat protein [Nitrososphaeraceae archaeon]